MVGAWFGAFPIPLDWDRPWQVLFPLITVLGTVFSIVEVAYYLCCWDVIGLCIGIYNSQNSTQLDQKQRNKN